MNFVSTWGGLLPLWILGAPLLFGVFQLFTAPNSTVRGTHDHSNLRDPYPNHPAGLALPPAR